jgi:hypothetical protein
MNPRSPDTPCSIELVDIIDFKWLMAHEGHHVHVERLQVDPAYAAECFAKAARSSAEACRNAGERLARGLALRA